jgi:outer membrane protein insertion porin family
MSAPAWAQDQPAPEQPAPDQPAPDQPAAAQPAPPGATTIVSGQQGTVRSIVVVGNQRLEPETVISYMPLRVGEPYDRETLDAALRALFETELFADVRIRDDAGALTVEVRENPVINRIVLEGNKRLKDDKINPEIKLAPRQIFTRSKARADVARIIELYRRQGRFAAEVEPKIVQLDQNRVDVVFEINEGPRSKVRQINILGNEKFSDSELRGEMATKQSRIYRFFSSSDTYDPDRLAYDQQKLRQFYLTEGYADFRVVSAVAELTPDKRDFIITYVVEEGERYKFGDVKVESEIRDFRPEFVQRFVPFEKGDWYDAKRIEDTVTAISEAAGLFGYAFAEVRPEFDRDKDALTMSVTFTIADAPRVYVERIDIHGNTVTRDKVIRREFRLLEGDPFNSVRVKRSRDRIQSLGFFQDNLEIEQQPGSTPDRVILAVNVEEKSTGELQVSAGFSSLERFLVNLSITQRNFMGRGQTLTAAINYSNYSKSAEIGFLEPYVFDRNISMGGSIYRRDYNSFRFTGNERDTTYQQTTTGGRVTLGVPITEYLALQTRYSLNFDDVSLDEDLFFTDLDGPAGPLPPRCDPLKAGRYLCDALGERLTSALGYSFVYDSLDSRQRPTRGQVVSLNQDVAGLGGDVHYLRTRASASKYFALGRGFVFSTSIEGGYIHSFDRPDDIGEDSVRLTDRFFLGEPQLRGFDIRGVGPRVQRIPTRWVDGDTVDEIVDDVGGNRDIIDDALGGRAYYLGRAELEIPLGSSLRELGLRPSVFADVGALFKLRDPILTVIEPGPVLNASGQRQCIPNSGTGPIVPIDNTPTSVCPAAHTLAVQTTGFREVFVGDTPKPRLSVGFGVNWNSPFGPFRIDVAKALIKADGDDTKLITFNVGTAF